jgi:hypothetical protein
MTFHSIVAAGTGSGDLVVGLLLGLSVGLLVGPAFRSWLVFREWTEASRQEKLADRLLTRLEADALGDTTPPSAIDELPRAPGGPGSRATATWRTSR